MQQLQHGLWHTVLLSFRSDTPDSVRTLVYDLYQNLAAECGGEDAGILVFTVERNLDTRKGVHLVELALFRDNDALQAFRVHPKHKEVTDILSQHADWLVGDFTIPT